MLIHPPLPKQKKAKQKTTTTKRTKTEKSLQVPAFVTVAALSAHLNDFLHNIKPVFGILWLETQTHLLTHLWYAEALKTLCAARMSLTVNLDHM